MEQLPYSTLVLGEVAQDERPPLANAKVNFKPIIIKPLLSQAIK